MADWMTVPLLHQDYTGEAPRRVGLNHPSIAPYGAYACKGGDQVVISIQNNREWKDFCEQVLQRPELVDGPAYRNNVDRCTNRPALDLEINGVFGQIERADLMQRLQQAKIAFGSVNSVADLAQHQQLRRTCVATPSGTVELVAPPVIVERDEPALRPVPGLGEHSDAIRGEYQDNA
jgi:crotonobetainyl-CoA:carnitine CoA-transferase CaiB-like acyl-CoA transferase